MNGEPAATEADIDDAVEALRAAGVTDAERYRWVFADTAAMGYPASYLPLRALHELAKRRGEVEP